MNNFTGLYKIMHFFSLQYSSLSGNWIINIIVLVGEIWNGSHKAKVRVSRSLHSSRRLWVESGPSSFLASRGHPTCMLGSKPLPPSPPSNIRPWPSHMAIYLGLSSLPPSCTLTYESYKIINLSFFKPQSLW